MNNLVSETKPVNNFVSETRTSESIAFVSNPKLRESTAFVSNPKQNSNLVFNDKQWSSNLVSYGKSELNHDSAPDAAHLASFIT